MSRGVLTLFCTTIVLLGISHGQYDQNKLKYTTSVISPQADVSWTSFFKGPIVQ